MTGQDLEDWRQPSAEQQSSDSFRPAGHPQQATASTPFSLHSPGSTYRMPLAPRLWFRIYSAPDARPAANGRRCSTEAPCEQQSLGSSRRRATQRRVSAPRVRRHVWRQVTPAALAWFKNPVVKGSRRDLTVHGTTVLTLEAHHAGGGALVRPAFRRQNGRPCCSYRSAGVNVFMWKNMRSKQGEGK
jgi:hypothetical protein